MNSIKELIKEYFLGDRVIWFIVLCFFTISMLVVYSSSSSLAYKSQGGATSWYLYKQVFISLLGIGLMFAAHWIPYRYYSRIAQILWGLSIVALIYTLFFGTELNDAKRWITLPLLKITFQTSDLAKLALIMLLARQLTVKQDQIGSIKEALFPLIIPVGITCALIAPENLSTATILFFTCIFVMFLGRVPLLHILSVFGVGLICLFLLGMLLFILPEDKLQGRMKTWKNRISNFTKTEQNPEDDYQVMQAKIAIAKGGLFKINPGGSEQKNFVPHPYSDEIYATIIEEYGLFGGAIVLALYLLFLHRCIRMLTRSPNAFGALLALGLGVSLVIQAFINMSVAVNLVPVTGVTLPLISMGGSSVFFTSLAFGIILSVSRSIDDESEMQLS